MSALETSSTRRALSSPAEFLAGISRKVARHVVFKPHKLALDEPIVAFTFDDFPQSVVQNAVPALEDADFRATCYLATGLIGQRENGQLIVEPEQVVALARAGHEIGGHTHGHINVQRTPHRQLVADVARNEAGIREIIGNARPMSFAYPFGTISIRSKFTLMQRYPGLRGIKTGINTGTIDLAHLRTEELYDSSQDLASIDRRLDAVQRDRGWLIFYTHDVRQNPTKIGASPRFFADVVNRVRQRGIRVEPVIETLARIGAT